MNYFFKNCFYSQTYIRQSKYTVMMTKEGSTKILNFITFGAGVFVLRHGRITHIVKMHYFCKNLHLYTQALIRQSKYIVHVMLTKEESTKIVKFHYPEARVLVLGHGHRVKMKYFFSSSCLHWGMDQTIMCTCIVMMTKEGST